MDVLFNASVISATVRIAIPILLAALGCLMCYKAGITNLAVDGFMLVGAFISIACVELAGGSVWLGMAASIVGTSIYSLLFGLMIIVFKANHVISSIALNMLSLGITNVLLTTLLDSQGLIRPQNIIKIPNMQLEFLADIPVLGAMLHNQSFIVLVALALTIVVYFIFKRTPYGLNVISLGESTGAAKSAGIKINRTQWSVVLLSGAFSGLAGSYLSTVILSEFVENMIQGRGITSYIAVVFGGANALIVGAVTLLFGWAEAIGIQIELAGIGIPVSIVQMFPYALAIIVFVISSAIAKKKNKQLTN